jgi:serine/threonine protein kinase
MKPLQFETTFDTYTVDEQIGEGGAGRVYGGVAGDGTKIALKLLTSAARDKRARFKNEITFLLKNKHANIITVIDHGLAQNGKAAGPFYVMPRYDGSLRTLLKNGISQAQVLPLFNQILDGVEAAHLKEVVHRDLKPENVLHRSGSLVVADFGIARFTEDALATLVQTGPTDRLANFLYAAPEQRATGSQVTAAADIYALGLMLNEMFTGAVVQGTEYTKIASVAPPYGHLDAIVERMIRQSPADRPSSIAEVKTLLMKAGAEAVSLQKISNIDQTVSRQSR